MAALTATQITCRSAQRAFQRPVASLSSGLPSAKQHLGLRPQHLSPLLAPRLQGLGSCRRATSTVVMVQQPQDYSFEIFCKGAPEGGNPSDKGTLLDCESSCRCSIMHIRFSAADLLHTQSARNAAGSRSTPSCCRPVLSAHNAHIRGAVSSD